MKPDHLNAACRLAASNYPTEDLCEPNVFTEVFGEHRYNLVDREAIGAEAMAMRGDESLDWLDVGNEIYCYPDEIDARVFGKVVSIESQRNSMNPRAKQLWVTVQATKAIMHRSGREMANTMIYRVHYSNCGQL